MCVSQRANVYVQKVCARAYVCMNVWVNARVHLSQKNFGTNAPCVYIYMDM